jgi:hypothetical protein
MYRPYQTDRPFKAETNTHKIRFKQRDIARITTPVITNDVTLHVAQFTLRAALLNTQHNVALQSNDIHSTYFSDRSPITGLFFLPLYADCSTNYFPSVSSSILTSLQAAKPLSEANKFPFH